MGNQIGGGAVDRFALRREPNGVYFVDGRTIPVRDNGAISLNDSEAVIGVHNGNNAGVGIGGAKLGVHIEE